MGVEGVPIQPDRTFKQLCEHDGTAESKPADLPAESVRVAPRGPALPLQPGTHTPREPAHGRRQQAVRLLTRAVLPEEDPQERPGLGHNAVLQRLSAAPATAESGPEGNNSPAEGAGNADKRVSGGGECGAEFTAVLHRQAAYDVGEPAGHPAKYDNSRSINTPATLASLHQPQPTDQRVVVQTPVSAGYAENPGFYWSVAGQDLWQSVLVGQLPWLNAA